MTTLKINILNEHISRYSLSNGISVNPSQMNIDYSKGMGVNIIYLSLI